MDPMVLGHDTVKYFDCGELRDGRESTAHLPGSSRDTRVRVER